MQLEGVIKILFFIFFSVPALQAQKRTLSIVPELGFQIPLASNSLDNYTKGTLLNNDVWFVPSYGIALSYGLENDTYIILRFLNGQAGYSMGVKSNIPCSNGYNGSYSDRYQAISYNEKRLIFGVELPFNRSKESNKISISTSFQTGIGVDFRSKETENGTIFFPGTNRCGEEFYLKDSVYNKSKIGLILPFQVNLILKDIDKRRLILSAFFHVGLTKHFKADVDYVTQNYREKATFISRGTSLGMVLSYPINVHRKNK